MNGLAQITLDGQPVALKFGMPALQRIAQKMSTNDLFNGEQWNDLGISHILYAGYMNYCAMKDILPVYEFDKFYSYVEDAEEEATIKEIAGSIQVFVDSKMVKELVDKKKATLKTTEETTSLSTGMPSNPLL